jgi:serine/threonine protein kinase
MKSKILKETVKIPDHLSEELKDLLLKMLEKDPSKRITLIELLSHQWISKNEP